MKKYLGIIIVTCCLAVGLFFMTKLELTGRHLEVQSAQTSATNFEIELQTAQPFFTEQMQEIGMLQPQLTFAVVDEQAAYYQLKLGQATVLVEKEEGVVKKQRSHLSKQMDIAESVKVVNQATVFAQPDTASDKIAELRAGYRYPVVEILEHWYRIELGGRSGYIAKQNTQVDEGIPVLVYHHILPKKDMTTTASTISQESFEQQIRYLNSAQFTTITTEQLHLYLQGQLILPIKALLITFDDGLLSTKEYAYPILKEYQFTAVQHMISSRIGSEEMARTFEANGPLQFFTRQEMELLADVFHYEAHTHDLHRLQDGQGVALQLTEQQIAQDLLQNVAAVDGALSIAYPFGHYNKAFMKAAQQVGIAIGFTTSPGYAHIKTSPYEVGRLGMTEKTTFEQFTSYIKGEFMQ